MRSSVDRSGRCGTLGLVWSELSHASRCVVCPGYVAWMMPTLVESPPEGDDWIHEIKYDGYRTIVAIDGVDTRAYTRNGHDW